MLLATAVLITALEFLPSKFMASWHWLSALAAAVALGIGVASLVGRPAAGKGWRPITRIASANLLEDRRLTFVAAAVVVFSFRLDMPRAEP